MVKDIQTKRWADQKYKDVLGSGYVLSSGAVDIDFSSGSWNVGDVTGGNYVNFGSDGTISLNGNATVWEDIRIQSGSFDRPGASDPAINTYTPGGAGTSTYLYEFAKNDIVSFTIQLPHSYKEGTDIYCHIHWTPGAQGAAQSGNTVGWKVDYSWASIDGAFGSMATLDLSDACNGVDHEHNMTTDSVITGSGKTISSMLICNAKRTDTGADDTWSAGGGGDQPMLLEIDFHFQIDTIGSNGRLTK